MARSSIRAVRVGGALSTEIDRGAKPVARQHAQYWCVNDHCTAPPFAEEAQLPATWECATCGESAVLERGTAVAADQTATFFRTPYEFLMMRRTPEEGEELLAEALANLARKRSSSKN
jgi:hypothetical protein